MDFSSGRIDRRPRSSRSNHCCVLAICDRASPRCVTCFYLFMWKLSGFFNISGEKLFSRLRSASKLGSEAKRRWRLDVRLWNCVCFCPQTGFSTFLTFMVTVNRSVNFPLHFPDLSENHNLSPPPPRTPPPSSAVLHRPAFTVAVAVTPVPPTVTRFQIWSLIFLHNRALRKRYMGSNLVEL